MLYDTRNDDHATQVGLTLSLCREFCQALFDVRQRENDVADSVLRVSFELNNHLYNTHDRALPEAFRERTLDFYITLCHRLMKQRNRLGEETDALLRACWSLAEMLFSIRQNKRDGAPEDEELLGSAVQACWELCDLFREGWTAIRPDRGTPRPAQATFHQAFQQAKQQSSFPHSHSQRVSSSRPSSSAKTITILDSYDTSDYEDLAPGHAHPETPTTIFEDTGAPMSPSFSDDSNLHSVPNILVLGPEDPPSQPNRTHQNRFQWSSSSSQISHANSEKTTSSSSTIINPSASASTPVTSGTPLQEDPRLTCLKLLILRAAMNLGYMPSTSSIPLSKFVRSLPADAFGTERWQKDLLGEYKGLVARDEAFKSVGKEWGGHGSGGAASGGGSGSGSGGGRVRASRRDVARAVKWMVGSGQYLWLGELYRWVVGCRVEEGVEGRGGEGIISS
jgi:hypothetical protein